MRKIIHIDMDAFYASIEQRDFPEYRGKPLAVGYSGARGVVSAASYEARKYGVRSAMASKTALRKCPHIIFVPARFDVYKDISKTIRQIFFDYTDMVEPLSLDEAFLDVTVNYKNMRSATQIAMDIKKRIFEETGLTASAGVSYNKFLAKMASDENKPNGLFVIRPQDASEYLENLPVERFWGVGKVTAEKMHQMGIHRGYDLRQRSESELVHTFGKAGHIYYQNVRGVDERPVEPNRIRKSVGAESTFEEDIDIYEQLELILDELVDEVISRINKASFEGRTVTLKLKYADFRLITRSKTLFSVVKEPDVLKQAGMDLLRNVDISPKVRLLGISVKKTESVEWGGGVQLEIDFDK